MEFREQTLDNGLEIVAECNPQAYSAAFGFFVKTGARDETDDISGVSHFLEHMVFKGTPSRTADDVNRELDEIGSHANAFTSEEQTVYYASVLPEYQERAIDLLSDIMRPSLREADFETEKQVILEEIAKYEDQPPFGANEKCMAQHFGAHPLGKSILGSTESVSALTADQMRDYFQRRYSPTNISLVAAGKIDFQALVAQAERACGAWQPMESVRSMTRATTVGETKVIKNDVAAQQYVVQIANGPAAEDSDRWAGRVMTTILGDDSGSRLFWELVDTGLAEYAAIGSYDMQGTGIYMTFLCCAPEDAVANIEKIAASEADLQAHGVTPRELQLAKNKICAHLVLKSERPSSRLFSVGGDWVQRREYQTVRNTIDAYQALTVDDIADVLAKYPLTTNTTVAVGPLDKLK